jgi:hypothetical protein
MNIIESPTKNKARIEYFNSFGEMYNYAKDNDSPQSSNGNSEQWAGTKTLAKACDLARNGWTEVRPMVDDLLGDLTERLADKLDNLYKPMYDFGGAYVDMGRFVEGDPECMVTFQAVPDGAMGRVIKIAVSGTASSYIDAEDIKKRGIAIISLVDTISKLGFGVELWWDSTIEYKGRHCTAVKLHDSADTLDINSVMFALAHPSMLRRLTFSVMEQSSNAKQQNVGGSYGSPSTMGIVEAFDFDVTVEKLQDGRGDIVQNPMAWVMTTLKGMDIIGDIEA